MPLDPGPVLTGVAGTPVAFPAARGRALAGIRLTVLIALGARLVLLAYGSSFVFPGATGGF